MPRHEAEKCRGNFIHIYKQQRQMYITLAILAVSVFFFVNGKVRSDIVALCALTLLLVFHILTPGEALSGFSNSVVIMMVGLFVVGGAIFQTGLAKMIGSRLLKLAGNSELKLFLLIMLVTSAIGAFVSNTGTVALMMPIVVSMAAGAGTNVRRLLMPLAFAGSLGGMLTLIGTPPNLIINDELIKGGYERLTFFSFLPIGIVCVAVGIVVLLPLSKWFLSSRKNTDGDAAAAGKSLQQLAREYSLSENLYRVKVGEGSTAEGKSIRELDVRRLYRLNILEVRRTDTVAHSKLLRSVDQKMPDASTVLQERDVLYVSGEYADVLRLAEDYKLDVMDTHALENASQGGIDFYNIGIAELILLGTSHIVNRYIRDIALREKYGINVLGVRRNRQYILRDLKDVRLMAGDVLLVQGTWDDIARLSKDGDDWVILGQPLEQASRVTLDYKAPVAAVIMLLMVAMMAFDFIPVEPVTAVIIAALLMVLTGCFRNVEAAYKTINWESIVLIAAMLPMSMALEKTGVSEWVSHNLVGTLGAFGPMALLAGIYFTTSLLTMFISNTATAVLLAPIAMQAAIEIGASPYPFLFAVAVGASMCFASPFSTPPNALVMPAGQYTFADYVKVGLPLQVIMGVVMVFVLPLLFPF